MFAATVPGLRGMLAAEIAEIPGATVTGTGADGRSDLVLFEVDGGRAGRTLDLRTAEDVFVEAGRAARTGGAQATASRIWRGERVTSAIPTWGRLTSRAARSPTYRVIVRVLGERAFARTELRRELTAAVARDRPRWRPADPARLEVWVLEYRPGLFVAGLRASDASMRTHGGRPTERPGALRPVVAAAMVRQAGAPGVLLDPCCGSGTILVEAVRSGWRARGVDLDRAAVRIARGNVPEPDVEVGDVRRVDLPDASMDACVSNLPFGRTYRRDGDAATWLGDALAEMARVTRSGGRVVVLAPEVPRAAQQPTLRRTSSHRIRLLGLATTIWCYDRTDP
jgi:SAM-dependent methyltransferase